MGCNERMAALLVQKSRGYSAERYSYSPILGYNSKERLKENKFYITKRRKQGRKYS
jgi:hypothetical protein